MSSDEVIVLIEDDEDIRNSIRDILEFEGYQVRTACNGQEGLKLLQSIVSGYAVVVILLDLMMSVMSGWEFIPACRGDEHLAHIPIVVLTAGSPRMPEGANGLLKKPLSIDELLEVIRAHRGDRGNHPAAMGS